MRKNLCCYGYVFAIINSINGKMYIGQSISGINQSVKRILRNIKNSSTSEFKSPLGQDILKYGPENFQIEILEEIYLEGDEMPMVDRVEFYRRKFDTVKKGYNCGYRTHAIAKPHLKIINTSEDIKNKIIKLFINGMTMKDIRSKLKIEFNVVQNVLMQNCLIPYSTSYLYSQPIIYTFNNTFISEYSGLQQASEAINSKNMDSKKIITELANSSDSFNGIRYDVIDTESTPEKCPIIFVKKRR